MTHTQKRHHQRGQSVIEFAFAMPALFCLIYGICDFGRAMYTFDLVGSASRIGSRYAIVHGSSCTLPACPVSAAAIQTYVRSKLTGVTTNQVTVTTTWSTAPGCTNSSFQGPQCVVRVAVSYPFQFLLSFDRTLTMTSSSQMVISQ
jgi:Flp pilus assembly protein TadG